MYFIPVLLLVLHMCSEYTLKIMILLQNKDEHNKIMESLSYEITGLIMS